jgi:uncharacterized protein YhfF
MSNIGFTGVPVRNSAIDDERALKCPVAPSKSSPKATGVTSASERRSRASPAGTVAPVTHERLPLARFAFPGPQRDALVSAVLSGHKVATTSLLLEYELDGEPLPVPGQHSIMVDSSNRPAAVIETTSVSVIRLGEVDIRHVIDEGEGFTSVAEWRAGHEEFWHSDEMRRAVGDPAFSVDEDTPVVLERFHLVDRLSVTD